MHVTYRVNLFFKINIFNVVIAGCPFGHDVNRNIGEKVKSVRSKRSVEFDDWESTTVDGCTCESECDPSIDDLYEDDWCYTGNDSNVTSGPKYILN